MVVAVTEYSVRPDKADAYMRWAEKAMKNLAATPGVVEVRAYRTVVGSSQVVTTTEFTDMEAYAAWVSSEEYGEIVAEFYTVAFNGRSELWGPSPVVPEPMRPGK